MCSSGKRFLQRVAIVFLYRKCTVIQVSLSASKYKEAFPSEYMQISSLDVFIMLAMIMTGMIIFSNVGLHGRL